MQITKDTVVTLKYMVKDTDGNMVDEGTQPLVYLHGGYGGIFATIEEALNGKDVGEALALRLQPDQAFGDYDADLVDMEDRAIFPENLEIGMQFERCIDGEDEDETQLYTVTDIADGKVVLDGNHPLAGLTLSFACTVINVRAATEEEIEHGHPHNPGQCHH